jgi:DNA repair exonuclease SbcCD nuclease subunit
MTTTFVFRTDVHLADRGPVSWKADYTAEILDCLTQIGAIASKVKADAVLDGGDFFHVKAANRTSHALVSKVALLHKSYPCPVYSLEGNHDITYNDLDSVERQPLGVLFETGVFRQLREEVIGGVRVVGVPYTRDRTLADLRAIKKRPGDRGLIAVVHALAAEAPSAALDDLFGEPVFRYSDLIVEDGPDVWMFGHWHKDQGVTTIGEVYFVNQGSVSRGALTHDNLDRTPKVAVIRYTDDDLVVKLVPLRVLAAADAFDLDRKGRADNEANKIESFVVELRDKLTQMDRGASIEDQVKTLDFAQEVRDMALSYLERARLEA